jgi:hypothetical protein
MNIFVKNTLVHLLGSVNFENLNNIKNIVYFYFPCIFKKLKNITPIFFLQLFGQNMNSEHDLRIF